jgi:hypothetical protein
MSAAFQNERATAFACEHVRRGARARAALPVPRCSRAATFGSLLAALPLIVRLSSERVRQAVRQDCSFAK